MWGLRRPTPRGRTESCTLHILADMLTGAHGEGEWISRCGLRMLVHAVDFPALRARAHISVAVATVD